jgi:hypothetical protein
MTSAHVRSPLGEIELPPSSPLLNQRADGKYERKATRIVEAIEKWPYGFRYFHKLQEIILDAAIRDIERILRSKPHCPSRQDLTRYHQVQFFLNLQKKHFLRGDIKPRMELAEQVAFEFKGGRKLATRIIQREREWVRRRYITYGLKGKSGKVCSMLDDEGTLLAVRVYIAIAKKPGSGKLYPTSEIYLIGYLNICCLRSDKYVSGILVITAQDLATAVVNYWTQIAIEDPDQDTEENSEAIEKVQATILSLSRLDDNPEKWSLSSRTAVNWLHRLGYDWKSVK